MISSILELSTSHITYEDNLLLDREVGPIACSYPEGWFIVVPEDETDTIDLLADMATHGFSSAALRLVLHAHTNGHRFLRLDADADVIDGFPAHQW